MASRNRVAVAAPVEDDSYDGPSESMKAPQRAPRTGRVVRSGWGAPATPKQETVKAPYLELKGNGRRIIKILNEKPPVHYFQHFVQQVKRSYTCGKIWEDGKLVQTCPLCNVGHKASARFMMNVIDMEDINKAESISDIKVRKWDFGNEVSTLLQGYSVNPDNEYWPVDDEARYFEVYHVSVAGRSAPSTKVDKLKARDLQEDFGIEPFTTAELEEIRGEEILDDDGDVANYTNLYGEEVVWISTQRQLEEIADKIRTD